MCSPNLAAQTATGTRYFYDDSSQLSKSIDSFGNEIDYIYDATGNLIRVIRGSAPASGALSLLDFTPQTGAIGSTVTITGQNFSATPASNTVAINGVAATVVSATSSSLIITVPSTATTGPITVTVGGITAASSSNFTVVTSPAVLSISPKYTVSSSVATTLTNFTVSGANLTGATFSFAPAFTPASVVVNSAAISSDGATATLNITIAPGVKGSFTLLATNAAGSSSPVVTSSNTFQVIDPNGDADGDGLTNAVEIALGSDPFNPQTSGAGLADGWQVFYGLNLLDPGVAGPDPGKSGNMALQDFMLGLSPRNPNRVPPGVTQITPANGTTGVYINSVVVARFGEPLQAGVSLAAAQIALTSALGVGTSATPAAQAVAAQTLQGYMNRTCCGNTVIPGTVTLSGPFGAITGGVTASSDGLSVTFSPSLPLTSNTTYTVQANGVRDSAGNLMTTADISTFTTGAAVDGSVPKVTLVDPENNSTNVPTNVHYTVQFSKAMDPATLNSTSFSITDQTTNLAVPGTVQVDPSGMTAAFVPTPSLPIGRSFTVTLSTALKDTVGNSLASAVAYYFSTGYSDETAAPHLVSSSPTNGSTGIAVNAIVDLRFSQPLNITTVVPNVQVSTGGAAIPVQVALSSGDEQVTITPVSGLQPNATYTVTIGPGISNIAGALVDNPGTFAFQTSAAVDKTRLSVLSFSPSNSTTNVPLNATVQIAFNKTVDVVSLGGGNLELYPASVGGGTSIPGAFTATPDGLNVTFAPSASLLSQTQYCVTLSGVVDLEGQALTGSASSCFTTGSSMQTVGPAVLSVSPANGATGVPVNATVEVGLNEPVSVASVGSAAITVTAGGNPVAGTVTVPNATTLLFTPSSSLAVSTAYAVSVGGFTDLAGNAAAAFTSGFTTGTSTTADTTGPSVLSITPASGSTNVAVTTPIVVTFNEPVNPVTVTTSSVAVLANGQIVAGSYAVAGAVVTFTPLTPLPGSATIRVYVSYYASIQDFTGNIGASSTGTNFTTAATADTTVPTVLMVTPSNGQTGVGLNGQITVVFSKSMNPTTLTTGTITVLAQDVKQSFSPSISADNRTLVITNLNLPGSTVITLAISGAATDLSGNSLGNYTSQFTTVSAIDTSHATVVSQRPGNGATAVLLNASPVVLFVSKPLNAGSVTSAMHVSQNGQLVPGTVSVIGNGQTLQFTPSGQWGYGALVQVFLDPTAVDLSGNTVTAYKGSFTVVGDPSTTTPTVVNYSPMNGATGVPLNAVIDMDYSEALTSASVGTTGAVVLNGLGSQVAATVTLDLTGMVIHVTPAAALSPNAGYCFYGNYNTTLQGVNGKTAQSFSSCFHTGASAQTTAPTVTAVSPANKLTNVPLNTNLSVQFSAPVDPLTVTGTSISLSGGGQTAVPASISFSNGNQTVGITPEAPLPASTVMTLTVTGVTDVAGNAVTTSTSTFTTGTAPATARAGVVATNPIASATGVPVNAAVSLQANAAIDGTTVSTSTFQVYDQTLGTTTPGTYSLSADGMTVFFVPSVQLAAGRAYSVYFNSYGMTDVAGNLLGASCSGCLNNFSFTTGFTTSGTPPLVTGVSPANSATQVPINAQIAVLFNEPVNAESRGGVTLSAAGSPVSLITSLSAGNQFLTITPVAGLLANTTYSLTVTGVSDPSGHAMTTPVTSTFTTAGAPDLSTLTITAVDPSSNTTGVPLNAPIRVRFNKPLAAVSVSPGDLKLYPQVLGNGGYAISGAIALSADGMTATFTPGANLLTETPYCIYVSGVLDLEGNSLSGSSTSCFTTGTSTQTTGPAVLSVSPVNAATGIPVNATVEVSLSEPVSTISVGNNAIAVTAGGNAVAGTVTVASPTTLLFTPTNNLAVSTAYTVTVGGFTDLVGNAVTAFTSGFTTGSSATADKTRPSVLSVTPPGGSTNVAVTTPIVVTFDEPVNPITVTPTSVTVFANNQIVAGSYAVSGAVVTFTPQTQLPGGATIRVFLSYNGSVQDFAGNNAGSSTLASFTTVSTADTTAPTVTMVTPSNGQTNVGVNGQITVVFSKSMNPTTLTVSNIALLAGDVKQSFSTSISADNRTLVLSGLNLPASTVVTLAISSGATDLSGNSLANYTSQFTTVAAFDTSNAKVVNQRPAAGATGVLPSASPVVLFVNKPLNASSVTGAMHVSQNGQLVAGTVSVVGNGQTLEFTPTSPWTYGALVQVFLDATAVDLSGNAVTAYQGVFTVTGDPATSTPAIVNYSPMNGATGIPLNVVVDSVYSGALDPATVIATNVFLNGPSGTTVASTLTLDSTKTLIHLTPNAALTASSQYCFYRYNLKGTNGTTVSNLGSCFTTGTSSQTTAPTVTLVSPANHLTNIPLNTNLAVTFSVPVDPLTVTGTTISLTGGGQTAVPASISFSANNQTVRITPQAPLPASTAMTLSVTGVTDVAGNAVTAFTSGFTTGTSPATTAAGIVASNPVSGATGVPVNAALSLQANSTIDGTTVNTTTFQVYDQTLGTTSAGTYSLSADSTTVYFVPTVQLATGRSYTVYFNNYGMTDLAGNPITTSACSGCLNNFSFTTGFATSTAPPQVTGVSPATGLTQVPINAQIVVAFNEPVNAESLGGVTLSASGSPVSLSNSLSAGNQFLTITPVAGLQVNTTYTLSVGGAADLSGNAMTTPVTSTFTTGGTPDLSPLTIVTVDPSSNSVGVPLNAPIRVRFSKGIDVISLGNGNFVLYPSIVGTATTVSGNVVVSAGGANVTFTPSSNLLAETRYCLYVNGVTDLEGQALTGSTYQGCFITGAATQTTGPAVLSVSPTNSATGVPVNASVEIGLNEPVSTVSVANSAVTVTAGGNAVAGTVTVPNATTLLFTPANSLAVSTAYTVTVGGFTDLAGNAATAFTSGFTTGSSTTADTTGPSVLSITPASGSTNVAVTTQIVVTFNEPVNPVTVTSNSVAVLANNQIVAGGYTVAGAVVTFTPLTPLPGGATIHVYVSYYAAVQDLAGNNGGSSTGTNFTTAATFDTTAPTVLMVTPSSGQTGVGQNGQVTVTFSESMNPTTLTTSTIALLAEDVKQSFNTSISTDNRTLVLSGLSLPGSTVITLAISNAATDLSGNSLASYTSQFTTASAFDTTSGKVVTQRPGNGATGISTSASPVVLFISKPLTVSSATNAFHIAQNGQLVPGTVSVVGNGQTIQFTPSSPFTYGALVQVFLDATAVDLSGNAVTAYKGSFTAAGDPTVAAPTTLNYSPMNGVAGIPLNVALDAVYSAALDPTTVVAANVYLNGPGGTAVPSTLTLDSTKTLIHLTPSAALTASSQYCFYRYNLKGANATTVSNQGSCFTTGTSSQTAASTVTLVSPANNLANVPLNANIGVNFSVPIDPLTVTGTTVALTGGGQTAVPASLSFSNNNQTVEITPQAPLPPSTAMTVTVNGVTDLARNAVTTFTSTFTTGTAPATAAAGIVASNPVSGETGVPVNAALSLQANAPIDGTTINTSTFQVYDQTLGKTIAGAYSLSTDSMTVYFVPSVQLATGRSYTAYFNNYGMTDLAGNPITTSGCTCLNNFSFTTGFATSSTAPQVVKVSPTTGLTQVPINAQIVVSFNEPVNAESLAGVTLSAGGSAVGLSNSLSSGNQLLTITPVAGLLANTTYTLSIGGVADLSGNPMATAVTSTFTTGAAADLSPLTILSIDPSNGSTEVPLNVLPKVRFSKQIDIVSLGGGNLQVYAYSSSSSVAPGTVSLSADGMSATLILSSPLLAETHYCIGVSGVVDLEGQALTDTSTSCFFTGTAMQTTGPSVVSVSPANSVTGVPVNATVEVGLSEPVSVGSVGSVAIAVTAGGNAVAGTVTIPNATTLLFTPSSPLAVSTAYTVTVGGFTDLAGNAATAFTSGFTTGSSTTADKTGPAVLSITPASSSTNVAVTTSIVVTFNEPVNPVTVTTSSVAVLANNQIVAGNYAVGGSLVTFTPLTPLPGSATIRVYVSYYAPVQDFAGNNGGSSTGTNFTTAATLDTTVPVVTMVTPTNGQTGVGLNGQITVVFSKSMNPTTLTTGTITVLAQDVRQSFSPSISADNRTLVLSNLNLPGSTVVTLAISSGATDLSGNALASYTSQFTTASAFDTTSGRVVTQRPGNGAANVSINASPVVLFVSKPLTASSAANAMHVSQNGQLVSGTVSVVGNGQTIQFTPSSPLTYGALVQVFLDTTAVDLSGNPVTAYKGSFTVIGDPATTAPALINASPMNGATGVPLNAVVDAGYNGALAPATVLAKNVYLYIVANGNTVATTLTLDSTGTVIHLVPVSPLSGSTRYCYYGLALQGVNGVAVPTLSSCFTTGTNSQTNAPGVLVVSPENKLTGVPLNANVSVQFTVPVDPLTVSGTTISLTGGGQTAVPASISFSNGNQTVQITPEAPLPASTGMTITVNGVTDIAGNAVSAFTSGFTTGTAPATTTPGVVVTNPVSASTGVPVNAALSLRTNAPVDGTTVGVSSFELYDQTLAKAVSGTYSLSADGMTVYFVPTTLLATGRTYSVYFNNDGMTDVAGNSLTTSGCSGCVGDFSFITGSASSTTAPQITGVSPAKALTGVPINAEITVAFNEPVNAESLAGVTLSANGSTVGLNTSLRSGNQLLTITPVAGLLANTTYTLTVGGVADLSGNAMTTPFTSTFVTGGGPDLSTPTVLSVNPANSATGVLIASTIQVQFSKDMNPISINSATFTITSGGTTLVPGTVTVNPSGTVATFTPTAPLATSTAYTVKISTGANDLEGQAVTAFSSTFTTGTL